MNKWVLLGFLLASTLVKAEPVYIPSLQHNATGASTGATRYGLDVNVLSGSVTALGSSTIGSPTVAGDVGSVSLSVRKDSAGVLTGVDDGDYTPALVDSAGSLKTVAMGKSTITTVRNLYTSQLVTTGSWVPLVASLSSHITEIEVFDSSGQTMELGLGASTAEVRLLLLPPGGNGKVPVAISSGARVSIRAVSGNATVGEVDLNFYQ